MKKSVGAFVLSVNVFAVGVPHRAVAEKPRITLDQAREYAIKRNFRIKGLRHDVDAYRASHQEVRSAFLPRAGIVGGVSGYGEVPKELAPVGYAYAEYNLFNGYRDMRRSKLASLKIEKAGLELSWQEFSIGLDVEEMFHTYIYYSDLVELQKAAIDLNNNHKNLVDETKKAGRSSPADVMEFQLNGAILRSDLELLSQKIAEARSGLKMLLGEEIGAEVTPVGRIQHQHLLGTLMSYLNRIKASSVPVRMASLKLRESQLQSSSWVSSWLPSIDVSVKAGQFPAESRGEKPERNISFMLTAKYEIYSGFESYAERARREALKARDASHLKYNIQSSLTEMEIAYRRLKTIEKRVDLEAANVQRSLAYYRSVKKEYLRGYKNAADLASAADRYTDSQRRKIQFMYEFLVEKLKLERAMGGKVDVEIIE